ncbi:MAG: hypothetical protein AW07_01217 [Candidatus Accumulibacter sp. SK-11]|nr:MAG: hypothetical protein AW07_01217 [Candidatus Accumulibacter sp. SK-11]
MRPLLIRPALQNTHAGLGDALEGLLHGFVAAAVEEGCPAHRHLPRLAKPWQPPPLGFAQGHLLALQHCRYPSIGCRSGPLACRGLSELDRPGDRRTAAGMAALASSPPCRTRRQTASAASTPSFSISSPRPRMMISPRSMTRYWSASERAKS